MKKTILFILTFMTLSIQAQWSSDTTQNLQVVDDSSENAQSISTSTGGTYIVFWKVVAAPTNYELRMQYLDDQGNKQLGNNGILISNTIPMSTFTFTMKLAIDGNDNIMIGITGSADYQGYAFKLDATGNHIWNTAGINTSGVGFLVTFLSLSNGETIITWDADNKALMQKYDSNGNPIWSNYQAITLGSSKTAPADLYELSNGDYMTIFHKKAASGVGSTLYAQRYDTNGNAIWTNAVQLSNKGTFFNKLYSGAQDGDIIYYGYSASSNNRFDSYLQRINADGTLPWGINGVDFDINQTNFEQDTKIAYSEGSSYIWSICTYKNTTQSQSGEYIQKFDKNTGARLFTDNAKELFPISGDYINHASLLFLVNDNPFFLINNASNLDAVLLNDSGDFVWTEETKPVASYNATKSRVHLNKSINGQFVITFVENKIGTNHIYAQNFVDDALTITYFDNSLYFANPITTELVIRSERLIKSIKIYNLLGELIFQNNTINNTNLDINTNNWKTGLYLMILSDENNMTINKNILKK